MTIRILDINDQAPTFNQSQYQATVLENTQARIPVTFLPIGTEMIVSDWDEVRFLLRVYCIILHACYYCCIV